MSFLQYLQVQTDQILPTQWLRQAPPPTGAHGRIIKRKQGSYTLKVLHGQDEDNTRSAAETETTEDPIQLMGASVGYTTHTLHSTLMERYLQEWPKMYETDPDLGPFWKSGGHERWEYWIQDGLLWKSGLAGARLCVPRDTDKADILTELHESKMAAHPDRYHTKEKGRYTTVAGRGARTVVGQVSV